MYKPTMGSLFAGIGGFELGFERAGFKTSWQVEIDPYCQKVLAKNFPEAERFGDIRECGSHNLKPVDVICGGFPCQDISVAGNKAGIHGERSGLWSEQFRVIRELRPRVALIENVSALVGFGLERVLSDLASIGFDAEWKIISARDVGARHLRRRIWIVSYPKCSGLQGLFTREHIFSGQSEALSVTCDSSFGGWGPVDSVVAGLPDFDGVSLAMARLGIKGLGNAVVPQIPEMIARRIKEALNAG